MEQWKPKDVARLLSLVESERRYYQEMVALLPVPLAVVSPEASVIWANRAFRRAFGVRSDELRRRSLEQVVEIEGIDAWIANVPRVPTSTSQTLDAVSLGRPVVVSAIPIRNSDEDAELDIMLLVDFRESPAAGIPEVPAIVPEISEPVPPPEPRPAPLEEAEPGPVSEPQIEEMETEEASTEEEATEPESPQPPATSRTTSGAAAAVPLMDLPAIVWEADASTLKFQAVSGAAQELLGYAELEWIARPEFFLERIHPEDRAPTMDLYRTVLNTGGDASAEFRALSSSGSEVWCRETIRVAGPDQKSRTITGVITAIGPRKRLEQQILRAGRMSGLESFAGRLAHVLNNPLMIANGFGEELLAGLGPDHPLHGDAQEIVTAAGRMSEITMELSELTKRSAKPPTDIYLDELMSGMEGRIASAAGENVTLDMVPSEAPLWVEADPEQLSHVLEAVAYGTPETRAERTRLTVSWGTQEIREQIESAPLKAGDYVCITIRDDGRGIDPEQRATIFDPSPGKAETGLIHLTDAYRLVRGWEGDIGFDSQPFRGSTFSIYLPLVEGREAHPAPSGESIAVEEVPEPVPEPEPTRETILVVDDEAGIRGLMRKILTRERYLVIDAGSAEEAISTAAEHGGRIDLLLTDVMLPGLHGPDLAQKLLAEQPDLKVLYISGYTDDESVRTGTNPPGARFLPKPFTLGALLGKVRETLDQ